MRRIGTLTDPDQAQRFTDYLVTLAIDCKIDREIVASDAPEASDAPREEKEQRLCHIWVRDETQVDRAKQEIAAFLEAPDDPKYRVSSDAEKIRKEKREQEKRKLSLQKKVKHSSSPGMGALMGVPVRQQSIPVVLAVIGISILASFSTGFGHPMPSRVPGEHSAEETVFNAMSFVDRDEYLLMENRDPFVSIKSGEVWRLITPIFLHGSTFHLAFNMIALFILGAAIERLQGSLFMAMLLLVSGIAGSLLQVMLPPADQLPEVLRGLSGTAFSIGASGAVYGLFGYLWVRPILSLSYPIRMVPANVAIMMGWLVFCIFFVNGIANGAHIGGLLAGIAIAAGASQGLFGKSQ